MQGPAFDEGPRGGRRGSTASAARTFPITTKTPRSRRGSTRATRCCTRTGSTKPSGHSGGAEARPGNAMAYWGMARASGNRERAQSFMKKALAAGRRRHPARARVSRSLGLVDAATTRRRAQDSKRRSNRSSSTFPTTSRPRRSTPSVDVRGNRVGADLLKNRSLPSPDHPGAHHYRVHSVGRPAGALALDSCRRYSELVPRIGHALHMPGHVYAGLGMWHEAAISLDSATRAEIRYMGDTLVFPYNTWNYAHNRNYLSYVQEQLGLLDDAIRGARELLAVPLDPKLNDAERFSPHWQGVAALTRALVKFDAGTRSSPTAQSRGARPCATRRSAPGWRRWPTSARATATRRGNARPSTPPRRPSSTSPSSPG